MTLDLDALEALAERATAEEWSFDGNCGGYVEQGGDKIARGYSADDAAFIAASRQAVPDLIAEIRRLREALAGILSLYRYEFWNEQEEALVTAALAGTFPDPSPFDGGLTT